MKDECSRCEGTYGKQDKTPSFLYSASTLDHEHSETFTRRDACKCKEIISEFTYPHNETRESSKGLKPLILEEVKR